MKAAPFVLHRPETVEEAAGLMAELADDGGIVLAGGQSLVPMMALRLAYPSHLIDINGIDGLSKIGIADGVLSIGATVRHAFFHHAQPQAGALGRLLATVVRHIAHYPIRQRGTFCGSLAHADPASEWCLVASTLDATALLKTTSGSRAVGLGEFIEGAMATSREADEMLVEARLPLLPENARFGFYEFNRRAGDFALGMALAVYETEDGLMRNVRIGLGGIEERPRRIEAAEAVLEGRRAGSEAFAEAAQAALAGLEPMEDATTSSLYRRDLAAVVIRRALESSVAGGAHNQ